MLFDGRDPDFQLHALVDFAFRELVQLHVEAVYLCFKAIEAVSKFVNPLVEPCFNGGQVIFGRHVLDEVADHFAEFFGRSFLGDHFRAVYYSCRAAGERSRILVFV